MSLDGLKSSEQIPKTEKQDFSAINTEHILEQSKNMARIREEEYADNLDNKTTIPVDLEGYFPEEDVIVEGKESKTEILKKELYNKLGLSEILEENSDMQKFEKGLLDGGLLDNLEMLEDLANSSIEEIIQIIKQLSNWETIKAILIDLYESLEDITKIFTEPYAGGVALGALGIGPISKSLKTIRLAEKFGKTENIELLNKYSEILGEELRLDDIIGEGNNALIVAHPIKKDKVLKIAKDGRNIDRLDVEFETHTKFQEFLKNINEELTGDTQKFINKFTIPNIGKIDEIKGIYEMDKINGLSIKSLMHLEYNKNDLVNVPDNLYRGISQEKLLNFFIDNGLDKKDIDLLKTKGITDSDIINFLKLKGLKTYPEGKNWHKEKNKAYVEDYIRKWFSSEVYKKEITPFNDIMKSNGFYHNDIHWGNYMIGEDGKINMIDFGNSEIK